MSKHTPHGFLFGGPFLEPVYGGEHEYAHGVWCSGSRRQPRTQGNTCSCYRSDLRYRKLAVIFNAPAAKRTLWVSTCPGCGERKEFPYTDEAIPIETFCSKCSVWAKVEELSWEGMDFAKLLPVFGR